ncbi:MAG TPA: hypothetical protein VFI28_03535 [Candidatus Limnocylindrales bacterium]|nr:hypothetical protein [Candidatus Limnocylindrales bacterium]
MKRRSARARARVLASAVAAALLATVTIAGGASAGNTRQIYIGDPDGSGILEPTSASATNQTAFQMLVRNTGKQNVTHVVVAIGSDAASSAGQPAGPSLPIGSRVVAMYGDGTCSVEADGSGAMCTFASLPSRSSVSDTIVLTTPNAGAFDFWASVKLDENTSDAGANTDTFFSRGHLDVAPNDGDHFGTFLLPDVGGTVGTGFDTLGPTDQGTLVTVPGAHAGTPVSIVEAVDSTTCAAGLSCFGALVTANVAGGSVVSPYLTWVLRWDASVLPRGFNPKQAGVVHVLDGGQKVVISVKKNACTTARPIDCIADYTLTGTYFEIVVRTASNGGMKGWG